MLYKILLSAMVLLTPSLMAFSQTFEQLYDADSTLDYGTDIFIRPDSSYMIIGHSEKATFQHHQLMTMTISDNGIYKTSVHLFPFGIGDCYTGNAGAAKRLGNGSYLAPITIQTASTVVEYRRNSTCGLAKFNADGDTVFVKTYNDTNTYFTVGYDCAVMPDGGYMLAGTLDSFVHPDSASINVGLLIRTDSNGNELWQRTYNKLPGLATNIRSVAPLDSNRTLIGASCVYITPEGGGSFLTSKQPWFFIIDNEGNILRDTLYGLSPYYGEYINVDKNGGYFIYGALDYYPDPDLGSVEDIPAFFAHLDTDFNMTWIDTLHYSHYFGKREPYSIRQTRDSGYVMAGIVYTDLTDPSNPQPSGWTGKIDKHGTLLWNKYHAGDSTGADEIADVAERADGSLIFCGDAWNDSLPIWHIDQDVWLISTDSNGCLTPGCDPDTTDLTTSVPQVVAATTLLVYPNPSTGTLIIQTNSEGDFYLYNIMGQSAGKYTVRTGETVISLSSSLASGTYIGKYILANGKDANEVRIVLDR